MNRRGTASGLAFALVLCAVAAAAGAPPAETAYSILISPEAPFAGSALRVLAAGDRPSNKARLSVTGPDGKSVDVRSREGGGPPFWRAGEATLGDAGTYVVALVEGRRELVRAEVEVARQAPPPRAAGPSVWRNAQAWDRDAERLYSAWVDALFRDADERASWPALHDVTRDPARNVLHGRLGLGEDDASSRVAVVMEPDCADNPYYLRAYFAWKLGLPFGFHECDRGTPDRAPRTGRWTSNASWPAQANPVRAFNGFLRGVMNVVHSGTARTRLDDDASDYYPLPLTRDALRPGAVFADPYGHTLVIVRWLPQAGDVPGSLLAVDAQPDGTVGIKRFWRGNFLFETSGVIGEPGFKAFRPIGGDPARPRLLRNSEIAASPDYGNISLEQRGLERAVFYDTMERLVNPEPLNPETALRDLVRALHEQLIVRVESVANGEAYMRAHPGAVIPMPGSAAAVFQAGGLWEDFSTPNRDLRLLIAIDTVLEFPEKVVRAPDHYRLPRRRSAVEVRRDMAALSGRLARSTSFDYARTDGRAQRLSIADILERREAFEMGYNPNDAIEVRWGAPAGSAELASGRRRAPASQVERMRALRPWFRKRLHPPT